MKIYIISLILVLITSCATVKKLDLTTVKTDPEKSVFVWPYAVCTDIICKKRPQWAKLLKKKKEIVFKIQDYLKKMGWRVTNYHYAKFQEFCTVGINKIHLDEKEIQALINARYLLNINYFPKADNTGEYNLFVSISRLKDFQEKQKVLKEKRNVLNLKDIIQSQAFFFSDLLFTKPKATDYISTAVIIALKHKGVL